MSQGERPGGQPRTPPGDVLKRPAGILKISHSCGLKVHARP